MQLIDLDIGQKARVKGLGPGDKAYRQRLLAMGLIPGTEFTVSRMAPLGDPVEIVVRGCALSLRKKEAGMLWVEAI